VQRRYRPALFLGDTNKKIIHQVVQSNASFGRASTRAASLRQ
jgi:hypothetical protein